MSDHTLSSLKQAMTDAGFEIYRVDGEQIRIAERVRMHLMESGVVVSVGDSPCVSLTVRGQRSHFPSIDEQTLFDKVRSATAADASKHGFEEVAASTREISNPADDNQLLDIWFEITFTRAIGDAEGAVADVRWALSVPKCVNP